MLVGILLAELAPSVCAFDCVAQCGIILFMPSFGMTSIQARVCGGPLRIAMQLELGHACYALGARAGCAAGQHTFVYASGTALTTTTRTSL